MDYYYVDREEDKDGVHLVHTRGCRRLPSKLKFIGSFRSADEAAEQAGQIYESSKCCSICTNDVDKNQETIKQYD